jgi:UrcA family protein
MKRFVRGSLTAIGLTAAIIVPAYAAPVSDPPSIRIPVSASDFATDYATKKLTDRISLAAREVCKNESTSDDGYLFTRACQSRAMEDAFAQVDRLRTGHVAALSTASIVIAAR